jgi:hypothetical protein
LPMVREVDRDLLYPRTRNMDVETILQGLTFLVPIKQALINLAPVLFGGLGSRRISSFG